MNKWERWHTAKELTIFRLIWNNCDCEVTVDYASVNHCLSIEKDGKIQGCVYYYPEEGGVEVKGDLDLVQYGLDLAFVVPGLPPRIMVAVAIMKEAVESGEFE